MLRFLILLLPQFNQLKDFRAPIDERLKGLLKTTWVNILKFPQNQRARKFESIVRLLELTSFYRKWSKFENYFWMKWHHRARLREGNCCREISLMIGFGINNFEYWTRSWPPSCNCPHPALYWSHPSIIQSLLQKWCGLSNWFVKLKLILWVNNNKCWWLNID